MSVRDDRGQGWKVFGIPYPPPLAGRIRHRLDHNPEPRRSRECDRVLYDCPDCGRAHFVTVDPCPTADEAAQEVAMVDG